MAGHNLESPDSPEDLYQARGEDVEMLAHRPLFTGDVLQLDGKNTVALLQHPCSLRRGPVLVPRLLVANAGPWTNGVPSDWSKHIRRMFLPAFNGSEDWVIEFDEFDLLNASDAESAKRIAIMSQRGVNLLLQRYIHHMSRVIVPTMRINEMITGQFDEADLVGDAVDTLVATGMDVTVAADRVDTWLSEKQQGTSRRDLLYDPQERAGVRQALRTQVRTWTQPI